MFVTLPSHLRVLASSLMRHCVRLCIGILLLYAMPVPAQRNIYDHTPNTRAMLNGGKTVKGYRLAPDGTTILKTSLSPDHVFLRLPAMQRKAKPELLGMLQHGEDVEAFLDWMVYDDSAGTCKHHIEIFQGKAGGTAVLVNDLPLSGGPGSNIRFFQPSDPKQSPTAIIDIMGTTDWSTAYLLAPDRSSANKLFTAYDYQFADLDRDGVYELIAWNRRPFDIRCGFAIADAHFYPEVFVPSGTGYRRAWPPADWPPPYGGLEGRFKDHQKEGVPWGANLQIVAGFADLAGDGTADLIALQDRFREEPAQSLAVYKLNKTVFVPIAQASLPEQRIAFLLEGIRKSPNGKQFLVRTATRAKCDDGGDFQASGTYSEVYLLHAGKLTPADPK
jgi:hypothetical protein